MYNSASVSKNSNGYIVHFFLKFLLYGLRNMINILKLFLLFISYFLTHELIDTHYHKKMHVLDNRQVKTMVHTRTRQSLSTIYLLIKFFR